MMIRSIARLLILSFVSIHTLAAQEPVQPYDASGRYRTGGLEVQLTGALGGGRDLALAWGAMAAGGPQGRWMQRTEIIAGLHAGQNIVDRLMVGPQVTLGFAVPEWYTVLDRGTRAEPYLVLSGGALGMAAFDNEDGEEQTELGIAPTAAVGVGFRLFEDEWDISLTQVEVVIQQRFGVADGAPQLYLRFSRAIPRRRAAHPTTPHPDGPGAVRPEPPER
ncbi:MAG TPA: hypothetical protein VHG93_26705 [Longimicrobium sp.]|nr:hypothetical protein [Longimicrobium sp.]